MQTPINFSHLTHQEQLKQLQNLQTQSIPFNQQAATQVLNSHQAIIKQSIEQNVTQTLNSISDIGAQTLIQTLLTLPDLAENFNLSIQNSKDLTVEVNIHLPKQLNKLQGYALVLHPHPLFAGTMHNKIVQTLVRTLADDGYIATCFNFRGVGQSTGIHQHGQLEILDAYLVKQYTQEFTQQLIKKNLLAFKQHHLNDSKVFNAKFVLAGFSFGTYIASELMHIEQILGHENAQAVFLIGSAAGKWPMPHINHLCQNIRLIHGEDDDVITVQNPMQWAKEQHLPMQIVPHAGHFFHGKLQHIKETVQQTLCYLNQA